MANMKSILTIAIAVLLSSPHLNGQNLFLIGEKSYPCTNAIRLAPNDTERAGLDVYFLKEGNSFLLGVITSSDLKEVFTGKLVLYLKDGNVISCDEQAAAERVDNKPKALFALSNDQVEKLKTSDIHTAKYTLYWLEQKNFSASNTGVETSAIIRKFLSNPSSSVNNTYPPPPVMREKEPFTFVEEMPVFPNGSEAMYTFIYNSIEYPPIAKANGISGNVIVQFVVSAEGEIEQAIVVRGIGGGCNEEALRVINSMPRWNPGKHNGINVPVVFTLPIKFSL